MTPSIQVDNLVKVFQRRGESAVRAVDGLSFDVAPGSIFGLLGPNGAGKSTTLRILTTILRPTSGRAVIAGYDPALAPVEVRRRIAVVIQEQAADLFLTVADNLITFARFHGLTGASVRQRVARVLEQFDLTRESGRKVQDLSGGFRRRVQVAKVFMVDTPVVFLDEFSSGMDPILKRSVMEALRSEARSGRTIVLTTQVLTEAEELCDDILIISRGRQVARGDLNTLKLLSEGVYDITITFDSIPPGVEGELSARRPIRLSVSRDTVHVALKENVQDVLALVSELSSRGRVLRVEVGGASLEDVFVELTGHARHPQDRP